MIFARPLSRTRIPATNQPASRLKGSRDLPVAAITTNEWLAVFLILAAVATITRGSSLLTDLVTLVFLLPDLAVSVRRLHDINRSGWWILLGFTGWGLITLIVLMIWPSQNDEAAQVF